MATYHSQVPVTAPPRPDPTNHTLTLTPDPIRPNFRGSAAFNLGVVQCIMGMALFIQQVMFIRVFIFAVQYTGAGLWTGILVMVTGVFGCLAGRTRKAYMISAWTVLSWMSVLFCVLTFATSIAGAANGCSDWDPRICINYSESTHIILGITMAVFSSVTGIISIVSASLACCCAGPMSTQETEGSFANPTFSPQPYPTPSEAPHHQPEYQAPTLVPYTSDGSQGTTEGQTNYPEKDLNN